MDKQIHIPELFWLNSAYSDIEEKIEKNIPQQQEMWDNYLNAQENCLDQLFQIEYDLNKYLNEKHKDKLCLFLFGSIARLEYIPDISDFDILPVCEMLNQNELEKEAQEFQDLESKIQSVVSDNFNKIDIDIHRVKIGAQNHFISKQNLIQSMGTELERSWSKGERCCLLWESVFLAGEPKFAAELRSEILQAYSCLPDFEEGRFPKLIYIFAQEILAQGIGNAIREMRPQLETEQETQKNPALAKLLFARFVGVKVKQLAWHLLYWIRRRDESFSKTSHKNLESLLNRPPIYWGIKGLTKLANILSSSDPQPCFEEWLERELEETTCTEEQIKQLITIYKTVINCVQYPRKSKEKINVGDLMMELWQSCWKFRRGDEQQLENMKKLGRDTVKLVKLTGEAARITQWLEYIRLDNLEKQGKINSYEKCWHLIEPVLFPESKPIWE